MEQQTVKTMTNEQLIGGHVCGLTVNRRRAGL